MTAILGALHDNTIKDHDASRFVEKVSSHTYREFLVTREELRGSDLSAGCVAVANTLWSRGVIEQSGCATSFVFLTSPTELSDTSPKPYQI